MPTKTLQKAPVVSEKPVHGSRNENVYQAIRGAIELGQLKPGQRVMEVEVGEWLGVSRTPVREALRRLETEGMLQIEPRTGLVVTQLDRLAVMELYEMRELLEAKAAALCAKNASDFEIAEMGELVQRERKLRDADDLVRHNRLFHEAVHNGAHNRYLTKSLSAINDSMWLLGPSQMRLAERARVALKEHTELYEAIARRDVAEAEKVARLHVQNAGRERMKNLFSEPARA